MEKIAKEFPVLRKSTYLNTAVYGPLYDSLIEWRQEHDLDFLLHGSELWEHTLKTLADTRATIGSFFNCKEENVALVYNFSIGLNLLLEGLDTNKKVLLLENDYPSLNWPFESRNFKTKVLKITANVEAAIEDAVKSENIDVFAFSIVQWLDGYFIDLEFIKRLKKANPDVLIIADGTQFCGASAFDFKTSGIDVLGTSGYKWLLSGYGNGFMLLGDNAAEEFLVPTTGFNAANGNYKNKDTLKLAKKLEPGHLSSLNFGSLKFSLDYLNGIGMDKITDYNEVLSKKVKKALAELGVLDKHILERKRHSTIFNIKADEKMFNKLIDNDILCSKRGKGIRISFNFYNNEDDLASLVRILKTAK